MKKIGFGLFLAAVVLTGCLKSDNTCGASTAVAPASEGQSIQTYLTNNSLTATKHASNLYYSIISPGAGSSFPTTCSTIQINYTGKLTNGTVFDGQNSQIFQLSSLIEAWKIGIPLLKKGGQIRLYVPPTLGYGATDVKNNSGVVVIPANSILIFDITLTDFQ